MLGGGFGGAGFCAGADFGGPGGGLDGLGEVDVLDQGGDRWSRGSQHSVSISNVSNIVELTGAGGFVLLGCEASSVTEFGGPTSPTGRGPWRRFGPGYLLADRRARHVRANHQADGAVHSPGPGLLRK